MKTVAGFRPDFSMLREIRLAIDPWLESVQALGPLVDPNLHSCGTVCRTLASVVPRLGSAPLPVAMWRSRPLIGE
jgi:hypothetical protein